MFKVVFGIYRSVSQHRDKDTAIAEINSGFRSAREAKLSLWHRESPSRLRNYPDVLEMQLNGVIAILYLNQNLNQSLMPEYPTNLDGESLQFVSHQAKRK